MSTVIYTDLRTVCRICLEKGDKMHDLNSPFSIAFINAKKKPITILTMLEKVMSCRLTISAFLPSTICDVCKNLLKVAYDLNILFFKSQETLDDILTKSSFQVHSFITPPEQLKIFSGDTQHSNEELERIFIETSICKEEVTSDLNNELKTEIAEEWIVENVNLKTEGETIKKDDGKRLCHVCGKSFSDRKKFNYHKASHKHKELQRLGSKEDGFLCDICGEIFSVPPKFRYHLLTHKERKFECHICSQKFHHRANLNVHVNGHNPNRDKICKICGKTFYYSNALNYHMRIHNKERNYVCEFCNQTFYMSSTLIRHRRIHTNDRPYNCDFCDKKFRSRGEKRTHERIHTGDKPHTCEYCNKKFISKYNMGVHHMSHPGEHTCDFCTKTFIADKFLQKHIARKHPDKVNIEDVEEVSIETVKEESN